MDKLGFAVIVGIASLSISGCTQNINPTDIDRAAIGAAAGATIAHVGGNDESDVYKGAAVGAAAGALCNDAGFCQ
ncbi:MAG: YMGG-like glycine zipper-containing protein [Paracoccus sp. (in: a-proteobacteria)]